MHKDRPNLADVQIKVGRFAHLHKKTTNFANIGGVWSTLNMCMLPQTFYQHFINYHNYFMKNRFSTIVCTLAVCLSVCTVTEVSGQVTVTQSDGEVTIGNEYLSRTFKTDGKKLKPGALVNKRTGVTFTPGDGSEEFALNPANQEKPISGLIDRTDWTVTVDGFSYDNDGKDGWADLIIDGDANTYWHSNYDGSDASVMNMPHWFLIDMQTEQTVKSFGFTPRQHSLGAEANGQVKSWELYAGNDPDALTKVTEGTFETFQLEERWVDLPEAVTCRYVKFVITSSFNGLKFANTAEFRLSSEAQTGSDSETEEITPLDRTGWTAEADSWIHESSTTGDPSLAIDGNEHSLWHSWYEDSSHPEGTGTGTDELPHSLIVTLPEATAFRGFGYLGRYEGVQTNGCVKGYEFYISDDKTNWTLIKKGSFGYTTIETEWVSLGAEYTAKYVKLTCTSAMNGSKFSGCAEFYLTDSKIDADIVKRSYLVASDMTVSEVRTEDIDGGKRVIFDMAPYKHTNAEDGVESTWDIDMVVEMKDADHFMRKYLLIKAADDVALNTPIDYIEMENLGTQDVASTDKWTRSQTSGGVGGMTAYTITLGQPVYIDGMFFGSEFPQAENEIDDDNMFHTRYYSGKSLKTLDNNEHRLNADGQFQTWSNVIGATRSVTDLNIVRTDFFKYINTIARPIQARMQYNSWYDWMLTITEERINTSFKEMERGFSQYGLRPMDSYVVDDGWNNYNVSDASRSGTTSNVSGFWEFNSKFPNGLQGASDIAHRYGSGFGIWLGPRGGYNFPSSFAKFLESKGNGTYSTTTDDIVTGDSVYVAKLREFFLKQQQDYGVNYWKLDGFATQQPQASKNGRYIVGGKNGNYYFTEHWERWYNVLSDMYKDADSRNSNLWINLTCYVNPSPWILQWSNSVWIQNSQDMGRKSVYSRSREMDQQLTYRDDRYYEFINNQQLQFPQANIFNHDPVYGKTDCVAANAMTDSEFRAYLYMMSTRGTAFWEMLYSYNLLNEGNKWMINAEALTFIDKNFDILRNSIYFGQSPVNGNIYGYSCWNTADNGQAQGLVSFRNPSSSSKTYTFTLDKSVGVPEGATGLYPSLVMEYSGSQTEAATDVTSNVNVGTTALSYGQTFTVTLKGGEIRLIRFGAKDETPAAVETATSITDGHVTLKFDEPVIAQADEFVLKADGQTVATASAVSTAADYRTLDLTFGTTLDESKKYTVEVSGLADWNGNTTTVASPEFFYNPGGVVVKVASADDITPADAATVKTDLHCDDAQQATLTGAVQPTSGKYFNGRGAFSLSFLLNTTESNATIASQAGAYSVALVGGKVCFTVGDLSYTADTNVSDGNSHHVVCLRENNGMIKVYVDGDLQGTAYDKAHVCEPVAAGALTLGEDGKTISLTGFELRVGAYNYSEVGTASTTNKYLVVTVSAPFGVDLSIANAEKTLTEDDGTVQGRVSKGGSVTFGATPLAGYTITSYVLNGEEKAVELTEGQSLSQTLSGINADQTVYINVAVPTGINETTAGYDLQISKERITVTGAEGHVALQVLNLAGQLVAEGEGEGTAVVSRAGQPEGAYIVVVKANDGEHAFKFVK